ncbi:hypothetical protein BRC83_07690 [Halobacteriales archaeon QS_1_68_17]|nr:MAG: hypothetical protein BRC83_07690 [Halobacteriales archaeon QS_1_68_17]
MARNTSRRLARMDYFEVPMAVGVRPDRRLPNRKGFCDQIPAKLTVTDPDWRADGPVPESVTREVAARATALLGSADEYDVFARSNAFSHGLGVTVDGEEVYVVYRSCQLGY